ncbi:hypothetical protein TNIN_187721 [Trichonephila inaurata madagascariensis]|uniref:Uncharacterized protein n=1 Tax=Trichonephila inaurata madagascariensis TaxID=2747483 RepID=A0A8X6MIY7_9ARAC|nr:hypothetical protein TNIN_187721 [Trichonephila inaurata madagascariensis]
MLTVIPPTLRKRNTHVPIQANVQCVCGRKKNFRKVIIIASVFSRRASDPRPEGRQNPGSLRRPVNRVNCLEGSYANRYTTALRKKLNTRPIQTKCNAFCNRKIFGRIIVSPWYFPDGPPDPTIEGGEIEACVGRSRTRGQRFAGRQLC